MKCTAPRPSNEVVESCFVGGDTSAGRVIVTPQQHRRNTSLLLNNYQFILRRSSGDGDMAIGEGSLLCPWFVTRPGGVPRCAAGGGCCLNKPMIVITLGINMNIRWIHTELAEGCHGMFDYWPAAFAWASTPAGCGTPCAAPIGVRSGNYPAACNPLLGFAGSLTPERAWGSGSSIDPPTVTATLTAALGWGIGSAGPVSCSCCFSWLLSIYL